MVKKDGVDGMYQCLQRWREGDSEALAEIVDNFTPLIIKEASKYNVKCYEYEDLVQHGYLSVIKAVNMFKGEGQAFVPYCIRAIIVNYKALLKGQIKHHREIPDEFIYDKGEYVFTIEDEMIAYEKTKELYEALDKLPLEERQIINGIYIKNNSAKEIAATTNMTYAKVRYRKEKALKKLKKMLKKHD
ncbi:RNA polymerase sigma factor (sigma-70 family) [Clostridium tetanomorphum]|nr:RNA polymerase sigma factor (sigma-70 family) [Clostridium tetanomorphum]NRS83714.1 RNA polymerase sigma factor (sigma-70 family) [Clostridium tetanomorphum]SQC02122.1 sigma-70 family RNA polymerase sigma factor [Clostridium tetanomorphum]